MQAYIASVARDFRSIETTPDGNCFYNAASISLFGHEHYSADLKVAAVFMLLENRPFYETLIPRTDYRTFESYVESVARLGLFWLYFCHVNKHKLLYMCFTVSRHLFK